MADRRPAGAPAAQEVGDWQAAERNAVAWLRWLGHRAARHTGSGADGGIDVWAPPTGDSGAAFAQVKWQGRAVGSAALQRLYGARAGRPGTMYFFTNAAYSKPASDYAETVGMATFSYSPSTGLIKPESTAARRIFNASVRRRESAATAGTPAVGRTSPPQGRSIIDVDPGAMTRVGMDFDVALPDGRTLHAYGYRRRPARPTVGD
ncbi:restriction endonuclease [Dactylosporangium sp. NPDC050688]|uniref:restriction endonuclease n=1 Tax=Dactylosporangium sp. NPDC050688 TaxID=3157217 RepID=UPI003400D68F